MVDVQEMIDDSEYMLEIRDLRKWFPLSKGFFQTLFGEEINVRAVDDISFNLDKGEILVLAGESGCGKTTTGQTIIRLIEPTAGSIMFGEVDLGALNKKQLKRFRSRMQIIFQDPYESLNPKLSVFQTVSEPLRLNNICETKEELEERVARALDTVRLGASDEFWDRYPHELSGGQRQRVAVARAITINPDFLVADEPVSMLDVSIRAEILNLLLEQRKDFNTAYLFITHDLAVSAYIGDRIAIMYLGKIVELGPADAVVNRSFHHYTFALVQAVPTPEGKGLSRKVLKGEPPSPINPPPGCRFHPRCTAAQAKCSVEEPPLELISKQHHVACWFPRN
ncbi:MAG: ABC transporter ATP-binding protein [Candidatus Hodarchaeales archaeon]|jgi:peptide/nickel transport system ATP-binding protein